MIPHLPERIRLLDVHINGDRQGELLHQTQLIFKYLHDDPAQTPVGLLMPPNRLIYQANTLFPVMDQNLPEGYLFQRIRESYPKQALGVMHLLALIGDNGIGRLGFRIPGSQISAPPLPLARSELLRLNYSPQTFAQLVHAYLSTGIGIAGMQPKILIPDRATIPIPNLIVKAGSDDYPGLAANEYLCLSVAQSAGIETAPFELSDDGQLLILDRFDLTATGERLGFEDIASLMGLSVRDTLADRKYHGSYEMIADSLKMLGLPASELQRFFEQVALTVMLRNGDGHLKNFGILYRNTNELRLSPLYDVVTTAMYRFKRFDNGAELEDRTLALRLHRNGRTKTWPPPEELLAFGLNVCGIKRPNTTIARLHQAMKDTLDRTRRDERIPAATRAAIRLIWEDVLKGFDHVRG